MKIAQIVRPLLVSVIVMLGLVVRSDGAQPVAATVRSDLTGLALGETYLWRPVAIGGGGFVTGFSMDARGQTRVVRTDVHGAYEWNERLQRWFQVVTSASMPMADRVQNGMNEGVYEIAVAPSNANRIYMVIKGRIYRSDDAGRSWRLYGQDAPFPLHVEPAGEFRLYGPFLAISPKNPDWLFLGTSEAGLWRSTDGAASWTRVEGVPPGGDLRPATGIQSPGILVWFEPDGKRLLAASARHGLFVSEPDGKSFRTLGNSNDPRPMTIVQASFAPNGDLFAIEQEAQRLWVFRDGKWSDLTTRPGLKAARFAGIAANPANRQIFLTDEGGVAWCSIDGGGDWRRLNRRVEVGPGDPPWLHVNDTPYFASASISFDPVVPNRLWVAAGTGPYVAATDASCTDLIWRSQVKGIEELVANDVLQPPGRAPLFAAWDFGIHVKRNLDEFSTGYGPKERLLIAAQQLDTSPSNRDFIVTNASDTRMGCCAEDGDAILAGYSLDAGSTWHKFATLPQPPGTRADDPWRMSFGTIAVSANSIDNIVWEPAFNRSPFFTLDRGETWHRVVLAGEKLPLTGSFERLYGSRKTLVADRVRAGTFYLAHSGDGNPGLAGLWRTVDGGRTWRRVFRGEIAPNSRFSAKLRSVPGRAGHLYFTSAAGFGADTRLRRSLDGGRTWRPVADVDHVDDIAFGKAKAGAREPTIFLSGRVGGRYGIWRSIDNATTWSRVAEFPLGRLDQVTAIEADKDHFGRVYVGYMGSGWLYGQPASCRPAPYKLDENSGCDAVQRD